MGTNQSGKFFPLMKSLPQRVDEIALFRLRCAFRNDRKRTFQGDEGIQKRRELPGELVGADLASPQGKRAGRADGDFPEKPDRNNTAAAELVQRFFGAVRFDQHFLRLFAGRRRQIFVKSHAVLSSDFGGGAGKLFAGGDSGCDFCFAVLLQCHHAVADRNRFQFGT